MAKLVESVSVLRSLLPLLLLLLLFVANQSFGYPQQEESRSNRYSDRSCEYFKNGRVLRGPCGQQNNNNNGESSGNVYSAESFSYEELPSPQAEVAATNRLKNRPNKRGQNSNRPRQPSRQNGDSGSGGDSGHGGRGGGGGERRGGDHRGGDESPIVFKGDGGRYETTSGHRKPGQKPGQRLSGGQSCQTDDGHVGICAPASRCFYQFDSLSDLEANLCPNEGVVPTVCCPSNGIREPKNQAPPIRIPRIVRPKVRIPPIDVETINEAARSSQEVIKRQLELEVQLVKKGIIQTPNSMEAYHQAFFGGPDPLSRRLSKDGLIALETTMQLAKKFNLEKYQARDGLTQFSLFQTSISEHCPVDPECKESKYRTIDGSCNNIQHPLWGKSHTAFSRLVLPEYADGLNELRVASDEGELPGPRVVSALLATDVDIPEQRFTLAVMQWGQFIDHDLTLSASTRIDSDRGDGIICCREEFARNPGIRHPACKPIPIPADDHFFSKYGTRCTNFVRNSPSPRPGCFLGPREQRNTLSHYMDGSMVYGSTDDRAAHLRSFVKGRLRNAQINGVEYLPYDSLNRSDDCAIRDQTRLQCFVGGDVRVNEQTGLTVMHMLLLREHNRIADKLSSLNPSWNDEIIYQETRRILAAVVQHITYNEWMPLIQGRATMKKFNLLLKPDEYTYDYDEKLNGGILNAFATAAYRFHTLIQGIYKLMNNQGNIINKLVLRNLFNNPTSLYTRGAFDGFLNSLTSQPTQNWDQFFSQELTNHLFQEHDKEFGMDLISLNIQRGRDHGIPGYNAFRKVCGLQPIESFEELSTVMREGSAEKMAQIYRSVDDIDLFIAGNHERASADGGVVGPTFACILAEQARRSKLGDRFWYELGGQPHSFSQPQLQEIRKSSLAAIICANSDGIDKVQPLAMVQPSTINPKVSCDYIPQIDLSLWKNEPVPRV
ncbi:peroxidase-like isoform X2 [Brevipalpus obovatus]|uniref:peroxidase-like isoform X2 n=1 Tax=Brevipalpus obovatus TaxID=246614 RepID=UPI003D9E1A77